MRGYKHCRAGKKGEAASEACTDHRGEEQQHSGNEKYAVQYLLRHNAVGDETQRRHQQRITGREIGGWLSKHVSIAVTICQRCGICKIVAVVAVEVQFAVEYVAEGYYIGKQYLTDEQEKVLQELTGTVNEEQAKILQSIISKFGSPTRMGGRK